MSSTTRSVLTTDDLHLSVTEDEAVHGIPIVCVHGYPDDHTVWDGVAARLVSDRPVVRYDVRGSGASGAPHERAGYRLDQLATDLLTVLDAVSPSGPVHLVGHDWGSIQCWHAVLSGRVAGRVVSYTSISGPDLDLAGRWLRRALRTSGSRGSALRQVLHSSYLALFALPVLPEQLWRRGVLQRIVAGRGDGGRREAALRNEINGLELYRANMRRGTQRSAVERAAVPVLVIAPKNDRYVGIAMQTEAPRGIIADLRVATPDGGHWLLRDRPDLVADLIGGFVHDVERT